MGAVSYAPATVAELERELALALERMDRLGYPGAPRHLPLPPPSTGPDVMTEEEVVANATM